MSRWVIISYLFSITGLLLFFGKLADTVGRKSVFTAGFVIFTIGSLFCGMSQSIMQLILARGIQGFGASMLMANGPAIITAAFPVNKRGRALGILAMVVSAGLAVGPSLGGFLIRYLGWASIFFVNIPVGIAGTIFALRYLPPDIPKQAEAKDEHSKLLSQDELLRRYKTLPFWIRLQTTLNRLRYFDWMGAFLWMFIQIGYSLIIDRENILGVSGNLQKILIAGALGLFFLFLVWEISIEDPVLNLGLFRSRVFRYGNMAGFLAIIGMSSLTLLMPFYLQSVRGFSSLSVGFMMTAVPITIFICAPIAGRLSDTYGSRPLSILGITIIGLSLISLGVPYWGQYFGLTQEQSPAIIVAHLALTGAGFGIFQSPNSRAIMCDVEPANLGTASAMLATVRNLGLVTGTALSSSLLMNTYISLAAFRPNYSAINFVVSLRETFLIIGTICLLGIPISYLSKPKNQSTDPNAEVLL